MGIIIGVKVVSTAIILAGGFATRLRPLTLTRPKALLPILNRPLLDWIIERLRVAGIKEIILSVRYLADMIKCRYGDGSKFGVHIHYSEEVKPLGDGGPIKGIVSEFGINDTFLVVYGDIFFDTDIRDVIKFHESRDALATMVLAEVDDPSRYGMAVIDSEGRIKEFIEKPPRELIKSRLVNAGIYVFEPEVTKYFPSRLPLKLSRDIIPKLVDEGVIFGYVHRGVWSDIGVPKDYMKANFYALNALYPQGYVDKNAEVDPNVELVAPIFISDNVVIKGMSKLGPYVVINSNSKVGSQVRISESIILEDVIIEDAVVIKGSIIGRGSYVGKWARLCEGVVLGDEVVVGDEVLLTKNTVVLPYKEISDDVLKEGQVIL